MEDGFSLYGYKHNDIIYPISADPTKLENAINNEGEALKNLVLDFGGINYISSAGLRVLLGAQKKMNVQGSMELINVSEDVMDILEMTGFADVLVIK